MAKTYPPVPEGKKLIFRMSYTCPKTGRVIYSTTGRPFPILVDA